ncbi:MAG: TetR/AcrR family transcriptional regulator [Dermatophilaceae bacterium]
MSPRGRPRDDATRAAVLRAALDLLTEKDATVPTVEAIAARAGTTRPTIYRWWSSRPAVLLDAVLEATAGGATYRDTGDVVDDLHDHARRYARLLRGSLGRAYRTLLAEAQHDADFAPELRSRLIEPRREETRTVLRRGIRSGRIRPDIDIEAAVDQLYAPLLYRLLVGHAPLSARAVDAVVAQVLSGIGLPAPPAGGAGRA